jgi:hypothetical protein
MRLHETEVNRPLLRHALFVRGNPAVGVAVDVHLASLVISPLAEDALALLKAQEPRVMAYEELSTIDGAFIIESSAVHPPEWVFFFDTDAGSDAVWVQGFDGERNIICREDYGIYVRCWTYRPDQATREATPWDAQEQRDYEAAVEMAEYCERYEPTYNADDGSM